jgi:hypothetical protein
MPQHQERTCRDALKAFSFVLGGSSQVMIALRRELLGGKNGG